VLHVQRSIQTLFFPPHVDASQLLFLSRRLSVRSAVRWQAMGVKLLEQIGIVPLSNVWVTPVIALPVSMPRTPRQRGRHVTYLTLLMRETCPEGRLLYSEKFTAAPINKDRSAIGPPYIGTHSGRSTSRYLTHNVSGRARHGAL
jgi:hypothetical protein